MTDSDNNNLLNIASLHGNIQIVDSLIENGAELDSQNVHGFTPLNTCVQNGNVDMAKRLINTKRDLDNAKCDLDLCDMQGCTPLYTAVKQHHLEMVALLIRSGCDLDKVNEMHKTPLIISAELGFADVTKMLLDGGMLLYCYFKLLK